MDKKLFVIILLFCCSLFLQAQQFETILKQGQKLFDEKKFTETIDFLKNNEKEFEKADEDILGNYYTLLGLSYGNILDYKKSETYLLKAKSIRENIFETAFRDFTKQQSEALSEHKNNLQKDFDDFLKSLTDGDKKEEDGVKTQTHQVEEVLGKEHFDYALSLNNLGELYNLMGDYPEAEKYFLEVKAISEKLFGNEHPDYATSLNSLGLLYFYMGDFSKAEVYYIELKSKYEKFLGKESEGYVNAITNLGAVYEAIGNYANAEKYLLDAKLLWENVLRKQNENYAHVLNNLGALYKTMGDNTKAEKFFVDAKDTYEKILGKENQYYAACLNNLGTLYSSTNDYVKAEKYYLEAKVIREKILGKENIEYSNSLYNLGNFFEIKGDYATAEKYHSEAKIIREKLLGKDNSFYANSVDRLGDLCKYRGDYNNAEKYYLEAKTIREKVVGKEHPDYTESLNNLSNLYFYLKKQAQAQMIKTEADIITTRNIENNFSFLSEKQRELFWNNNKNDFEIGYSYTYASPENSIIAQSYNNTLFVKGLLLRTTNRIRDAIYSSNNDDLIAKYEYLKSNRLTINTLKQKENPNLEMITFLENRADSLDKALTQASAAYMEFNRETSIRWQNIRNLLLPEEAAIEFVHFRLYDGNDFTENVLYCALLLKKDVIAPIWIPLCNEKDLQELTKREKDLTDNDFTQQLYSDKGENLYNLVWQPLEKELHKIRTIYYSPSGMLHQIAFAAIPTNETVHGERYTVNGEQLLSDKYNLQLVSSTREINRIKNKTSGSLPKGTAAIYGGLLYDVSKERMIAEAFYPTIDHHDFGKEELLVAAIAEQSDEDRSIGIRQIFLPGTEIEAELVGKYLNDRKIPNRLYMYTLGNEESFKRLSGTSTGIIHLATHGFFLEDIENSIKTDLTFRSRGWRGSRTFDNPLQRSGLMMAGANRAWTGIDVIDEIEDGILTAEEISQLNLTETQLVVLSACQTGLGEAKTAEGVFGLQRAFKLAGVETLIMSLLKVPDNATADLMNAFYKFWLFSNNNSKSEAFKEAQHQVREKYKDTFYWAGFVMLD